MTRSIRFGEIKEASTDAGPHKLIRVTADGKPMTVKLWEPYGVQGSPTVGGEVLIFTPDGDDGRAVAIAMPPPKDRVDGQKQGEVTIKNHAAGQTVKMDADGNVSVECAGTMTIKAPKIVLDGNCYVGGESGAKPASREGTIDSAGHSEASNFATRVWLK
jgi:phage gp45-like